jgi:hypothetical protein
MTAQSSSSRMNLDLVISPEVSIRNSGSHITTEERQSELSEFRDFVRLEKMSRSIMRERDAVDAFITELGAREKALKKVSLKLIG